MSVPKHDPQTHLSSAQAPDGSFKRTVSSFRSFVEPGGQFPPEKDRYHLYISHGCPWANRTTIVRNLKGLDEIIPITCVSPLIIPGKGWAFKKAALQTPAVAGVEDDPLYGAEFLREIYFKAEKDYAGRFTVPVLWDKKTQTIVNNESSEIIRMLNSAFNDFLPPEKAKIDLYPEELRGEIDALNEWVYETVNNGVYKAGFATTQTAYEAAVHPLFESLDRLEGILKGKDYLVGGQLTEADVRLFTTIARFDVAYHGNFKCNIGSIRHNYPNIHLWFRKLYWNNPSFKDWTDFDHIKIGYYSNHKDHINPTGIVPVGPIPYVEPL